MIASAEIDAKIQATKQLNEATGEYEYSYYWKGGRVAGIADELLIDMGISRETLEFDCGTLKLRIIGHNETIGCYYIERVTV